MKVTDGYPPGADEDLIKDIWRMHGVYSRQDENYTHQQIEEMFGDDVSCSGVGSPDGPCGGCVSCVHGQASHSFAQSRAVATLYAQSGLRWAPYAIDTDPLYKDGVGEHHDSWACQLSDERPGGWPRYSPPVDIKT